MVKPDEEPDRARGEQHPERDHPLLGHVHTVRSDLDRLSADKVQRRCPADRERGQERCHDVDDVHGWSPEAWYVVDSMPVRHLRPQEPDRQCRPRWQCSRSPPRGAHEHLSMAVSPSATPRRSAATDRSSPGQQPDRGLPLSLASHYSSASGRRSSCGSRILPATRPDCRPRKTAR